MSDTDLAIDQDIENMLEDIAKKDLAKRLILFNDDQHDMLEVMRQVVRAREAGGQPCTPEEAYAIMMAAHSTGQGVVMAGAVENLKKARAVLESIDLRADIID